MKKTSKLFKLAIALAVACIAIVLLEVFNLHPQLNVGDMHFYWVGVKKMNFESSGPMIIPLTNGKTEIYKEHNFVLFTVVSTEDI
jgi:hypothetical protein